MVFSFIKTKLEYQITFSWGTFDFHILGIGRKFFLLLGLLKFFSVFILFLDLFFSSDQNLAITMV